MAMATISARLSAQDKSAFETFCISAGINASAAINMFIKAVLRENRIPFEIRGSCEESDPFYSKENMERLRKGAAEVKQGMYTIHDIVEVK